jgi:hypothetical protein
MLIHKTKDIEAKDKEIDELKKAVPAAGAESAPLTIPGTPEDLIRQIRQKDDEIKNLNEQNKILSGKLDGLYKTTSAKMPEINAAKASLEETVEAARRKIDDEWNTVDLGSIKVNRDGQSVAAQPVSKKKEGRVLVVNQQHGFVVVDLGVPDGVNPKTRFTVTREGRKIALLTVIEIQDQMTACKIVSTEKHQKLEEGDAVAVEEA